MIPSVWVIRKGGGTREILIVTASLALVSRTLQYIHMSESARIGDREFIIAKFSISIAKNTGGSGVRILKEQATESKFELPPAIFFDR